MPFMEPEILKVDWQETAAYHADGAIYCPDCWEPCDDERCHEGCSVYGRPMHGIPDEHMQAGDTCDGCGACWAGEWMSGGDARALRWSRCYACNHQQPWPALDSRTRLQALRGRLACEACGRPSVHF